MGANAIAVGRNKAKPHCAEPRSSLVRSWFRCNSLLLIAPYRSSPEASLC
jgi:hypothetical protein